MKLIPNYIKGLLLTLIAIVTMLWLTSCATPQSIQTKDNRQYNETHPAPFR